MANKLIGFLSIILSTETSLLELINTSKAIKNTNKIKNINIIKLCTRNIF